MRRPTSPCRPSLIAVPLLVLLLLGVTVLGPRTAAAAESKAIELPLANGKALKGIIKQATKDEVVLTLASGMERRVPWGQLTPLGVFRVRKTLAPPADGEARLRLAELAVDVGLYKEARVEYEKALGLGAIDHKAFAVAVRRAEVDAVKVGIALARHKAEAGDLEAALEVARQLRLDFGGAANARQITRLINDLVKHVKELDEASARMQAAIAKAKIEAPRHKEVLRRRTEVIRDMQLGSEHAEAAKKARKRGSITRARKSAEAADELFHRCRISLGRLRRILPRDSDMRKEVMDKLRKLDAMQFELLHEMAWFMWESTVFKQSERWAAKASYIDPVHPRLLELREHLVNDRIRYRVSDVTNARGIVR